MKNGRIAGTGSYVPETIWKNEDLEKMVETSDIWIRERTGIGARHIAGEETVANGSKGGEKSAGKCRDLFDRAGSDSRRNLLIGEHLSEYRLSCAG